MLPIFVNLMLIKSDNLRVTFNNKKVSLVKNVAFKEAH